MYRFFRLGRFYALAPDEGGGGGQDFGATMDAIAAQYPQGGQDAGVPAAPAAPAAAPPAAPPAAPQDPLAALDAAQVADDMPYRDAKRLRDEIVRARERYSPFAEAFDGLDPSDSETLLEVARILNGDGSREEVAAFLADSAKQIGGEDWTWPDGSAAPEGAAGATPPEAAEPQYLTAAELDQRLAERDAQQAVTEAQAEILAEIRSFGYDPESTDPIERGKFAALIEIAKMDPDGSIENAHQALTGWEQSIVDGYVSGKTADANRPALVDGGETPVESARMDTLDDAEAAMRARLDQSFGPR